MVGNLLITGPILGIISVNGHHEAITVEAGKLVETDGKKFNGERLMEVRVDGNTVLVFTEDLKANTRSA